VILRYFRLRVAARKAIVSIIDDMKSKNSSEKDTADFQYAPYSKSKEVLAALNDDELTDAASINARLCMVPFLVMKEFDTALPMTGLVYFSFMAIRSQLELILDKLVRTAVDPEIKARFVTMHADVLEAVDKRHSCVHTFSYLTMPILRDQHAMEDNIWGTAHFQPDAERTVRVMAK
jgi:hypothetical protein